MSREKPQLLSLSAHNALLAGISKERLRILASRCRMLEMESGSVLHEWGQPIRHLYFPIDAVISLFASSPDGGLIEAAIVGCEGVIGWPAAISQSKFCFRAVTHVRGTIVQVEESAIQKIFYQERSWRLIVAAYIHVFTIQLAQSAICNNQHSVERRLARWLMATKARTGLTLFPITHELLSEILGTIRPVVTVAARSLKKKRLIHYQRGNLTITNPAGLANAACSCYDVVHGELGAFLMLCKFTSHPFLRGPGLALPRTEKGRDEKR